VTQALVVSNLVLWVAVVVLACVVLALVRQIGVLYERVAPAGALALGGEPVVGEAAPRVPVEDLDGGRIDVGAPSADGRGTLLFFLSMTCPVCRTLLPAVRSIARTEAARLRVVLASDGGAREDHRRWAREHGLEGFAYVLSTPLAVRYRVPKLPYAVLVDAAGTVRAKGLVNTREHLESLLEAEERGVGSIQEFFRGVDERGEDRHV
jgi:methylamine dehydrogenase accessory protein MauD